MAVFSEVQISDLTSDLRIDSEYYDPECLCLEAVLARANAVPWGEIKGEFIVGPFGSAFLVENYVSKSAYRYVRGRDVKPFFLLDDDNAYIPQAHFDGLRKYELRPGDLLVSVVGTLGNVAIVTKGADRAVFSCKSTAFRSGDLDPYYLCAYLNSRIARAFFERLPRGHIQTGLNLSDLKALPILLPRLQDISAISDLIHKSYSKRQNGKRLYAEARELMFAELRLSNVALQDTLYFERSSREVFPLSRMDAEYYQPKYDVLETAILNCGAPVSNLETVIEPIKNGFDYRQFGTEGTPYVRVGDLSNGRLTLDTAQRVALSPDEISKDVRPRTGDILFTRKGTYGNAAVVQKGEEQIIISSEIMLLRLRESAPILPEFLAVYLNSALGYEQVERRVHGGAFYSISQPDLGRILIVNAPRELQLHIREKVLESHRALDDSKELLKRATHRVEELIIKGNAR